MLLPRPPVTAEYDSLGSARPAVTPWLPLTAPRGGHGAALCGRPCHRPRTRAVQSESGSGTYCRRPAREPTPLPPRDLSPVPGSQDDGPRCTAPGQGPGRPGGHGLSESGQPWDHLPTPADKGPFKRGQTNSPSSRNRNSEQLPGPEAQGPGP